MNFLNYRDPNKQRRYRLDVLKIYNNRCAITNSFENLEAAHIVPWLICNNLNPHISFCIYNGIILSRKLHRSEFETYKFTFDYLNYEYYDSNFVRIGIITLNDKNLIIYKYRFKKILIPISSLYFIRYHYYKYQEKNNYLIDNIENTYYLEQMNKISDKLVMDIDSDIIMLPL